MAVDIKDRCNIYGFELEFDKLENVENKFPEAHKRFKAELAIFLDFLDKLAGASPANKN